MKKTMTKRVISIIIALVLCLGIVSPINKFAASASGEWGPWSEWSTTPIAGNENRQVEMRNGALTGYSIVRYQYQLATSPYNRVMQNWSINGAFSTYGYRSSYGEHHNRSTATVSEINTATRFEVGQTITQWFEGTRQTGINRGTSTAYVIAGRDLTWFIDGEIYGPDEYRYRDREQTPVTQQYRVTFVDFDGRVLRDVVIYAGTSTITPANPTRSGYTFLGWVSDDGVRLPASSSQTFSIHRNTVFYAEYEASSPVQFTISITVSPSNGGSVIGGGTYASGATVTLQAIANSGFRFDGWYDGNNRQSINESYTFTATDNRTLQARFVDSIVPVTGITGLPSTANAGTPLLLSGTVTPMDATNRSISWSIVSSGTTGASLSGNTLNATAAGTVTIRATIVDGIATGTEYSQTFSVTVSSASPLDPFTMGEDNYRFINTGNSFGYPSGYSIPRVRFEEIFTPSAASFYYDLFSPWSGNCYGFASSSYAFETYRLICQDYQNGVINTYGFIAPGRYDDPLTRTIELYQIAQCLTEPTRQEHDYQRINNLSALIAAVTQETEANGDGLIVCFSGLAGGHAIVAYGITSLGGSRYSISVYDNNQPNNRDLRIDVDTSRQGSAGWAFNAADTQGYNTWLHDNITYVHGSVIHTAIENARRNPSPGNRMQISVPFESTIIDNNGNNIETTVGAYRLIPYGVLPLNPDGSNPNTPATTETWVVPEGEYTVFIQGLEAATVSVIDNGEAYAVNLLPSSATGAIVEVGGTLNVMGSAHGNIIEYQDDGTQFMMPITQSDSRISIIGGSNGINFSDVRSSDWFNRAVSSIAASGIVEGVGNNCFEPQSTLTVAHLVTILIRTHYGRLSSGGTWYESYMSRAERDGIIFPSDNLQPDANITRAQAALLITRFIEKFNPNWIRQRTSNSPIDMSDVPSALNSAVRNAYSWGIINGDDQGHFNPNSTLTRAEACQIIYNYYSIIN